MSGPESMKSRKHKRKAYKRKTLSKSYVESRLFVDVEAGRCIWLDPTKHHLPLIGKDAGTPQYLHHGKIYWDIGIDGVQYQRSKIVFLVAHGYWPRIIDHIDGNSLNDAIANLREVNATQNAWNHQKRKRRIPLPMGIRYMGKARYQARLQVNKKMLYLGVFDELSDAVSVYQAARKLHFGEYSGL